MAYASHLDEDWGNTNISPEVMLMIGFNDLRSSEILTDVILVVEGKKLKPCHR